MDIITQSLKDIEYYNDMATMCDDSIPTPTEYAHGQYVPRSFLVMNGNELYPLIFKTTAFGINQLLYGNNLIDFNREIILLNIKKVDLSDLRTNYDYYEIMGSNLNDFSGTLSEKMSADDIVNKSEIEDLYHITSINFYDNSNDGNYSKNNGRTILQGNNLAFKFFYNQRGYKESYKSIAKDWTSVSENRYMTLPSILPFKMYDSNFITKYSIISTSFYYVNPTFQSLGYGDKKVIDIYPDWWFWKMFHMGVDTHMFLAHDKPTGIMQDPVFTMTKKGIIDRLNRLGIPFTFDVQEALNNNTEDFTDYDPNYDPDRPPVPNIPVDPNGDGNAVSEPIIIYPPAITPIGNFNRTYLLTPNKVNQLATFLWHGNDGDYWWEDLFKLNQNPLDTIIALKYFPFNLTKLVNLNNLTNIKIGNVLSDISGNPVPTDYNAILDLGKININYYYGSFLDHTPNTTVQLYLPYIGFTSINSDDCIGNDLNIKYAIDILNGQIVAMVFVGQKLLFTQNGSMAIDIPLTGSNNTQIQAQIAKAGAGAIMSAAGIALAPLTGGMSAAVAVGGAMSLGKSALDIGQLNAQKDIATRGGLESPYASLYAPNYPYVIINRPLIQNPQNLEKFYGGINPETTTLSNLSGYVKISDIHLDGLAIPETHKIKLLQELKNGVTIQ